MSESEKDNSGCLGLALMIIGGFFIIVMIVEGSENAGYIGILLPIGYLMYSS